ncbi:MAG: nickel pincer cofactor biosynthesis protein LarC [Actinomycetales bacterium]|nr:nickel pincer cofactor biosynthesis protein LarC [Actinomycetales bacterium]
MSTPADPHRHAWLDVSAGVAGDMFLGALVDAGADLAQVQAAVDAVIPGSVRLTSRQVVRGGQRATKVEVEVVVTDPPHRTWTSIRAMLADADLAPVTRRRAHATFARLAEAEGFVHGTSPEDVHFHEVGALDSIADVVGTCEALRLLGVTSLSASPLALGSGRVRAAHGDIPVPVPAVTQLAKGWPVSGEPGLAGRSTATPGAARGVGELATPTGVALVRALASGCESVPPVTLERVGVGAGTKDNAGWPNVVRVLVGVPVGSTHDDVTAGSAPSPAGDLERAVQLEANVDDLDPRLWPGVLDALLAAGAMDAWLVPILMKKGRPAHTLCVLAIPELTEALADLVFAHTSSIGIRVHAVARHVLPRRVVAVEVAGAAVRVKVSHRNGSVVQATPEFADVAELARDRDIPEVQALSEAAAAAVAAGLVAGSPLPDRTTDDDAAHVLSDGNAHPRDRDHDHAHPNPHPDPDPDPDPDAER